MPNNIFFYKSSQKVFDLITIVGPTAIGKTAYACRVAYEFNGEIISANNQENVAYPSGLCAERVAIYYAGAKFSSIGIKTIAITAKSKKFEIKDIISPCGACRQAIAEYEVKQEGNIRILLHQSDNSVLIVESISELLPFMFKSQDLKNY